MRGQAVFTHVGRFGVFYYNTEQGWLRKHFGWVNSYSREYSVTFSFRAYDSEFSAHGACEESCRGWGKSVFTFFSYL